MSGQAGGQAARAQWRAFCEGLERLGDVVADAAIAGDGIDQAEGYRYLSRLLRIALEMHVENADPAFPSFYQASHPTAKIGADNPDNLYLNATIDGQRRYRITGHRGTVPILSFGTKANRYAIDGTMASTGELDSADMAFEADGRFEIVVSRTRETGNWLPLAEDSSMLLVRQTFLDRPSEVAAEVRIEAVDPAPGGPRPLDLPALARGFERSLGFVEGTARTFLNWARLFEESQYNQLATTDQSMFFRAGGDPTIFYLHGYWKLAEGEALVIETAVPQCSFWNFQCDNIWMESLDYRFHRIHVNDHSARRNADGTVTIVLAARDPGFGNWIDTAGHDQGTMLLRWIGADEHPVPRCRVVPLDQESGAPSVER